MTENTWFKVTEQASERANQQPTSTEKPLESWKEISAYLKRAVRTVKRWEQFEGLPVRRHVHQSRSSVYAYPSELDAWWAKRRPAEETSQGWLWHRPARVLAFAAMLLLTLAFAGDGRLLGPASTAAQPQEAIVRRAWSGPDVDILGAPSPDGRYLSYVDWATGDLALRDLAAGKSRRLTNKGSWADSSQYAHSSVFSPDGKQIAYSWFNDDNFYDLRIIGLDGSGPRVLYRNGEVGYLVPADWSPDGKFILAAFERKDRVNQIVLVSVADGSVRLLKSLDWRWPDRMSFSPDGRYLAYDFQLKEDSENSDIYLLAVDGSREVPLVQHPANDLRPVWAPDGNRVVFASDRTGAMSLWAIQVADGKPQGAPELLKRDLGPVMPLGFTRSGSYFYGVALAPRDVYVASLDLQTNKVLQAPARLTERFVGSNSSPDWSSDGNYIAYTSQRGPSPWSEWGSRVIVIRSMKTGEERELSPALYYAPFSHPRLSPDGRALLVAAADSKGRYGIYHVDAQTGDVIPIAVGEPGELLRSPVWSPEGKAIFYSRSDGKRSRVLRRDLETRQEKELYAGPPNSVHALAVARDGSSLAFLDMAARPFAIKVIPTSGGQARELLRLEPESVADGPGDMLAWTPDGRALLFIRKGDPKQKADELELWRISAEGGKPQRLGLVMKGLRDVRIHPDGKQIVFTTGEERGEVWVMENFLPQARAAK